MSTPHFYLQTIVHERREDGGLKESATRHGDYPNREIAESHKRETLREWELFYHANPGKSDNHSVDVNIVEGFWGYPE